MRVVVAVVIAGAAVARADGDDPRHRQAEQQATMAGNLARDGHCHEAVALRDQIAALDAEVAARAFADNPALAACAAQLPAADGSAANGSAAESPVLPPPGHCSSGLYLSPSVVAGFGTRGASLHRLAAGVVFRSCRSPLVVAVGGTVFIGQPDGGGGGGELEVSRWTRSGHRIGGHMAIEGLGNSGYLASVDLRLHLEDVVWLGAGLYGGRDQYGGGLVGGTLGIGIEGTPGAITGGVELAIASIVGAVILYSWSHSGQ